RGRGGAGSARPATSAAAGTAAGRAAKGVAAVGVSTAVGELVPVSSVAIYRSAESRLGKKVPEIMDVCTSESGRYVRDRELSGASLGHRLCCVINTHGRNLANLEILGHLCRLRAGRRRSLLGAGRT